MRKSQDVSRRSNLYHWDCTSYKTYLRQTDFSNVASRTIAKTIANGRHMRGHLLSSFRLGVSSRCQVLVLLLTKGECSTHHDLIVSKNRSKAMDGERRKPMYRIILTDIFDNVMRTLIASRSIEMKYCDEFVSQLHE